MMNKYIKNISFLGLMFFLQGLVFISCKSKDPSVLKVFVRDENDQLLPQAKVIVVGDTKSEPATIDYVDTAFTDAQGVAQFDMEEFYKASGKATTSGYFDILVKFGEKQAESRTRIKKHMVTVETVKFQP